MRVLIITDDLFEDSELLEPLRQLRAKGIEVHVAAPRKGMITGEHGGTARPDLSLDTVSPEDYDLLIVPGGKAPARLRTNPAAVGIARRFLEAQKPVAAICHGPQLLVATSLLAGRIATGYHGIKRELELAGVSYENREVIVDQNLITSRQPSDVPAFMRAVFKALGLHRDG